MPTECLFSETDLESALLKVPATESTSGTGTTIYRKWAKDDFLRVEFLYDAYAGGSEASTAELRGVYLRKECKTLLGILASKTLWHDRWRNDLPPSAYDQITRLYLFSRVPALRCDLGTFGNQEELVDRLVTDYGETLIRSTAQDFTPKLRAKNWLEYLRRVRPSAAQKKKAIKKLESIAANEPAVAAQLSAILGSS